MWVDIYIYTGVTLYTKGVGNCFPREESWRGGERGERGLLINLNQDHFLRGLVPCVIYSTHYSVASASHLCVP